MTVPHSPFYAKLLAERRDHPIRPGDWTLPPLRPKPRPVEVPVPADLSGEPLCRIARLISHAWPEPYFGAVPYIDAMHALYDLQDSYGADSGESIVRYFLANAGTWRGPIARAVKAELRRRVKR